LRQPAAGARSAEEICKRSLQTVQLTERLCIIFEAASLSFSWFNVVSFTLEGPLSVIFQSGIFKIPSDHQAQDGSAVFGARAGKTGANIIDLSDYHGRRNESNPKVCSRHPYVRLSAP
jgi:hypothetical protein